MRENVARLREEYDVEMLASDEVPDVDSWDAQQAALFVRQTTDRETFRAFYDAVMNAYWREGRDIADPDVSGGLAEDVGLAGDAVRNATTDETSSAESEEAFASARERGITGVPTFVADGHAARGAVPPDHLRGLVEGA